MLISPTLLCLVQTIITATSPRPSPSWRAIHHDTHTRTTAAGAAPVVQARRPLSASTAPSDLRDRFRIGAFTNECWPFRYRAMAGNSTPRCDCNPGDRRASQHQAENLSKADLLACRCCGRRAVLVLHMDVAMSRFDASFHVVHARMTMMGALSVVSVRSISRLLRCGLHDLMRRRQRLRLRSRAQRKLAGG